MGRGWWLGWVVILACTPEPRDLFLSFPADADADSFVFAVSGTGKPPVLTAVDVEDTTFSLDFAVDDDPPSVEVLTYDETLDELMLEAGPIVPAATAVGRSLPTPDERFELRIDGDLASWEARQEASPMVTAFRREICTPIEAVSELWDVDGFVRFAVPIDDDHVLFSTTRGAERKLFVSDGGPPVELGVLSTGDVPWSAWRGPGQLIWFGDTVGRLYRGTIGPRGFVDFELLFEFGFARVDAIDGHVAEDGTLEIFAVGSDGTVVQGDGTTFARVDGAVQGEQFRIMWRAPGEATVAVYEREELASVTGGRIERDAPSPGAVYAVGYVPALGEVIGVEVGEFYARRNAGTWRRLDAAFSIRPMSIVPASDGFFYLLASGRVGRYFEPEGFCPNFGVLPILGFDGYLTRLGDDLFAVGELNSGTGVTQGARVTF